MPTTQIADPGLSHEEQAEAFARNVIAGHPQGAVRRNVLYIVATVAVVVGAAGNGPLGFVSAIVAVTAVLLLALTDQLS